MAPMEARYQRWCASAASRGQCSLGVRKRVGVGADSRLCALVRQRTRAAQRQEDTNERASHAMRGVAVIISKSVFAAEHFPESLCSYLTCEVRMGGHVWSA